MERAEINVRTCGMAEVLAMIVKDWIAAGTFSEVRNQTATVTMLE